MPRLLFQNMLQQHNQQIDHGSKCSGRRHGHHWTPKIHKKVNMIMSVILGTKGSCGSGYGPNLPHKRTLLVNARAAREGGGGSGTKTRKPDGSRAVGIRDGLRKKMRRNGSSGRKRVLFKSSSTSRDRAVNVAEEKREDGVYELCKKRILLGRKCRTMNPSGKLRYDVNGILIPEDYIS